MLDIKINTNKHDDHDNIYNIQGTAIWYTFVLLDSYLLFFNIFYIFFHVDGAYKKSVR